MLDIPGHIFLISVDIEDRYNYPLYEHDYGDWVYDDSYYSGSWDDYYNYSYGSSYDNDDYYYSYFEWWNYWDCKDFILPS